MLAALPGNRMVTQNTPPGFCEHHFVLVGIGWEDGKRAVGCLCPYVLQTSHGQNGVDQKGMGLAKETCFSVESNENTFFGAEWVHTDSLLVP